MSGIQMTTDNANISSIIDEINENSNMSLIIQQIKESQQKVLKAFEGHNSLVNKSLEIIKQKEMLNIGATPTNQLINGERLFEKTIVVNKVFVKVKDPLEELKKIKKEFDAEIKKLDTEENRKNYESQNLKPEVLYPDKKIYFFNSIIDILCLYRDSKISNSFKEMFIPIFNATLPLNKFYEIEGNITKQVLTLSNLSKSKLKSILHFQNHLCKDDIQELKKKILKVRDIRWLLLELEKYPQYIDFTEDDLQLMKEYGASRDNIYLVKKFLKKDGDYEEYYPEEGGGIKLQYHMTGGNLNGEWKEYYQDGNINKECYYNNGKLHGYERVFLNNGDKVMESEYKEDKLHGEHKRYFQNKLILHSHYKDGVLDGEYKGFDMISGELVEHCFYKEGKKDGNEKLYINTKLISERFYIEGKLIN